MKFLFTSVRYIVQNDFHFLKTFREEQPVLCTSKEEVEVSKDDVDEVMERLGMVDGCRYQKNSLIIEEANGLLEEKTASVEELREAFEVFDPGMDGFITPNKLWVLMQKLGFCDGMRYEDCERMIRVYDKDSDGRISFDEFKCMMENAR